MVDSYLPVPNERDSGNTQMEEGGVHEPAETPKRASDREIREGHILLLPAKPLGGWGTGREGEMASDGRPDSE
eukprot:7059684-Pyramimonas_sp.AAC.2